MKALLKFERGFLSAGETGPDTVKIHYCARHRVPRGGGGSYRPGGLTEGVLLFYDPMQNRAKIFFVPFFVIVSFVVRIYGQKIKK